MRLVMEICAENKCGVLTRITGMFMKKSYNISALTVTETKETDYSIITATFEGDEYARTQLANQISKLYNVEWARLIKDGTDTVDNER